MRKSRCELEAGKNKRRVRYEKVMFLALVVIFVCGYWQVGSFNNFLTIVKGNPERAFALLFFRYLHILVIEITYYMAMQ